MGAHRPRILEFDDASAEPGDLFPDDGFQVPPGAAGVAVGVTPGDVGPVDRIPAGGVGSTGEADHASEPDHADGVAPSATDGVAPRAAGHRRRRRVLIAVAGLCVAGLVLAGLTVVDTVMSRRAVQRIAHQPGGLLPMPTRPKAHWTLPLGAASIAALGDDVIVVGSTLRAYDAQTGDPVWESEHFGSPTVCEAPAFDLWEPADDLVCVTGTGAAGTQGPGETNPTPMEHTVRVIGPRGRVLTQRTVTAPVVIPVSGGDIAEVRLTDQGAVVTRSAATSGAVRWARSVARGAGNWGADLDGRPYAPALGLWSWNDGLVVQGDEIDATLDAWGRRLGGVPLPAPRPRLAGGAHLGTERGRDVVRDSAGDAVWRARGSVLAPLVTDGLSESVLAVAADGRTEGRSASTGALAWSLDGHFNAAQARVGSVLVLSDYLQLTAVNTDTGHTLWVSPVRLAGQSVLTDGQRIVASVIEPDGHLRLTAIDLDSGKRVWTYRAREVVGTAAIGGHLVAVYAQDGQTKAVGLG